MPSFKWKISFLMFIGVLINYLDRVNISHTILLMSRDIGLSPTEQGVILSAFSWGYVVFMLPGGWYADRFGARIVGALSCAGWSFFTAVIGFANSFTAFVALRFLLGAAEAPIFPSNAKVVRLWFPIQERGRATAIFDAGSYVGAAIAAPFVVFVMLTLGWRVSFVACAVSGLIWSAVWYLYYRDPNGCAREVDNENVRPVIKSGVTDDEISSQHIKWSRLFLHRKIWGMSFGFFCYNYLKSFFLTWFPSYLVTERGFTILKVGLYSFIPPLCAVITEMFAGTLTDGLIKRGISVTLARKIPLCLGLICSSVVIGAVYVKSETLVIILMSLSYASLIAASPSIWAMPGDIAPHTNLVGSIGGIQNTFSNMAGIIAPIVTGTIYNYTGSFAIPLIISGMFTVLGALSYWFVVGNLEPIKTLAESQSKVC